MKKINGIWLLLFVTMGAVILLTSNCKKDEGDPPAMSSLKVFKITDNSACCCAMISSEGDAAVTERGVCWCTSDSPTTGDQKIPSGTGTGEYQCEVTGLSPNTTYYVRAYAINEEGTSYSAQVTFSTPNTVVDIDGNIYHTVVIGDQVWMAENLRVKHYRNGAMIPEIVDNYEWANAQHGAYSMALNRDELFYNAHVLFDERGIAPEGWHVATDADWKILEGEVDTRFKGGDAEWNKELERGFDAGGNLKTAEKYIWLPPNSGATNTSGFSAIPAGWRWGNTGELAPGGGQASYWTATIYDEYKCWVRSIFYDDARVHRYYYPMTYGGSVRCVKDE